MTGSAEYVPVESELGPGWEVNERLLTCENRVSVDR